jgi:SAM-dependent methyltransferase
MDMETHTTRPWQLEVFQRSLKKRLKVDLLRRHLGDCSQQRCLLVTCGDNNGAINHHLKESGGDWRWAEIEEHHIHEMEGFLGEPVHHARPDHLPFDKAAFDTVVSIDVHEHLVDPRPFCAELYRVVRPGGRVIVTVPNGDWWKPANVIKHLVGMTEEKYGHVRIGYNLRDLQRLLGSVGFRPYATGSYSKFFTEMLELGINFGYVMVLSRRSPVTVQQGTIAPSSASQLGAVSGAYRLYSAAYPVMRLISRLDGALPFATGYAVVVEARRPAS